MTIRNANIRFGVTGSDRKKLVSLVAEFTGCEAKYEGAPTFAYEVDYFTIDKEGTLIFDDRANSDEIENLLEHLGRNGFIAQEKTASPTGLTVEIPFENVHVGNLTNLLASKGDLIKAALGIQSIGIELLENSVTFPWFDNVDPTDVPAYTAFITALCAMTKKQTRINSTVAKAENQKYAFRCFLLRLGFIGAEYKEMRKILLRNLEGSSAFKSGKKNEVHANG